MLRTSHHIMKCLKHVTHPSVYRLCSKGNAIGYNEVVFTKHTFDVMLSSLSSKTSYVRRMSSSTQPLDNLMYERIADQTLDHLTEELELLLETNDVVNDYDISLNNGVLTVNLGSHGVYVINKQTPNKQIWFSSPFSGPKRYDWINNDWIYKKDGISLLSILTSELSVILKRKIKLKPFSD
ncbi:frataxin, mitochondrial-like [Oppia nitens]|uniref:frataxin, mitochondrial-like n=1 Tax=Oppia nitens TaxID=1686743 RepID=UPI0023D9E605|nr:frataxin, mitochondrial-like [Oppia nitens]